MLLQWLHSFSTWNCILFESSAFMFFPISCVSPVDSRFDRICSPSGNFGPQDSMIILDFSEYENVGRGWDQGFVQGLVRWRPNVVTITFPNEARFMVNKIKTFHTYPIRQFQRLHYYHKINFRLSSQKRTSQRVSYWWSKLNYYRSCLSWKSSW